MEFLNKRNSIIIGIVVVVLAGGAFFLFAGRKPASESIAPPPPPPQPVQVITREAPPTNLSAPNQNTPVPANVAAPTAVAQGSPSDPSVKYRSFSIKADNNSFTPDTMIVNVGDTVDLYITAVDKNYDFTQPDYGFKDAIAKGSSKRIDFTATVAGKFTYYCAVCGGPSSGAVGYIDILNH